MKTLIVVDNSIDAGRIGWIIDNEDLHVSFMFQALTGHSYDLVIVKAHQSPKEQDYVDKRLRTLINPGGLIIFL